MNPFDSLSEDVELLLSRLEHLEKHLAAQDTEIYLLSKRLERLARDHQQLRHKIEAGGGQSQGNFIPPADEKPPHY